MVGHNGSVSSQLETYTQQDPKTKLAKPVKSYTDL